MRGQGARTYYAIDWENFDERLRAFGETSGSSGNSDAGPSCACG